MKKLILLTFLISSGAWAELPQPKSSCQIPDLQARYARLFAAGSFCGKSENSTYAKNLNTLYLRDQDKCKVSGEEIDPSENQVNQAFLEIENLPERTKKDLCASIDSQIKSLI
ncbi:MULTISPECIES: hypothetical protein [Acinetobacter calcoaceticus/baumannii complex]|uniref:Uncharacterized protein n=1 Tax=Acinetobacter baumannii TaxID=470 RepID=A0A5N0FPZ7_ACIBA|nr:MULTISPECIES: hypothetical protein [Acinetobacter calcoaceticus/baumannii complex]CAH1080197.1 Uncharacterised protein [Acinetobacter phage MD-2021a]ARG37153.1 hypothetical protein B7L46_20280 [Acinetobacter baumannii]AVN30128.1 hypothetical protein AM467_12110 [Acinetobacter baumannii]EKU7212686.1 hypothetical protein [Acinetobacter baumannii]EKV6074544.1 hypothetical protein [Acinetobacter baumannii]